MKTLPELTSYIESRIRSLSRQYDWLEDRAIESYAKHVGEHENLINRVLRAEDRPTTRILSDLIGHMGITRIHEVSKTSNCPECGHIKKTYLYDLRRKPNE